jgi:hypothetical protein
MRMAGKRATRVEHFAAVGRLVNNAALADAMMFNVFRVLSGCSVPVAKAIFFTLDAYPTRRSLIDRVASLHSDPELTALALAVCENAKNIQDNRNALAHALLLEREIEPDELLLHNPKRPRSKRPVTAGYLESLIKPTAMWLREANSAFEALCARRSVPPQLEL